MSPGSDAYKLVLGLAQAGWCYRSLAAIEASEAKQILLKLTCTHVVVFSRSFALLTAVLRHLFPPPTPPPFSLARTFVALRSLPRSSSRISRGCWGRWSASLYFSTCSTGCRTGGEAENSRNPFSLYPSTFTTRPRENERRPPGKRDHSCKARNLGSRKTSSCKLFLD